MYNVELRQSAEGLQKSLCNEYRGFLRNQFTRQSHWSFPAVMKNYRANINPVRAIYYDTKEMIKRFNQYDDHHGWLLSLVTDNEFHHRVMKDIIGDRRKVDKIINFYSKTRFLNNYKTVFHKFVFGKYKICFLPEKRLIAKSEFDGLITLTNISDCLNSRSRIAALIPAE